ncbi:MAG: DUF1501 domain-containing protein [Planctomycetes bacterium]|nr:DUF1501 domain-containing protein [Planctomycetota bacterium]
MHRAGCNHSDHPRIGRRELLQVGGLSLIGASLYDVLRLQSQAATISPTRKRAKSVIFIFQSGGPSQYETFDPKPDAPEGIRGEYGTVQTRLPGIRFCEYLPRLASRASKFSIVKTMHHVADRAFRNEHISCSYLLHTGRTEMPPGDTNGSIALPRSGRFEWPSIGSMISYASPVDPGVGLPATIELPRINQMRYPGRGAGVLGPKHERWGVDLAPPCRSPDPAGSCPNCFSHDDPNDPARAAGKGPKAWWDNSSCRNPDFRLPDLGVLNVSMPLLNDRVGLLQRMEAMHRQIEGKEQHRQFEAWDARRTQAMQLLATMQPGRHNPFDLTHEAPAVRDRYGREEWGQGFLVARRLVEAGARMVQINLRGWDTHQNAFRDLKGKLLPSLDRSLSGLLDDLEQRGLLDSTLVVMCGEMGRTPKISPISAGGKNASGEIFTPGRHHWGDIFPCFFAGGGTHAGQIIGQSDKQGGLPATEAYTPADLAATIYHTLGIGPDAEFHDQEGRPYKMTQGVAIKGLVG